MRSSTGWLTCCGALAVSGVLTGCATADPSGTTAGGDCLSVRMAREFRMLDDQNLIVRAPQPYHIVLSDGCGTMPARHRVGLSARGDRFCGFAGDAVILDVGAFPERCPVLRVERLDEAALEELIWRFEGFEDRDRDRDPELAPGEDAGDAAEAGERD